MINKQTGVSVAVQSRCWHCDMVTAPDCSVLERVGATSAAFSIFDTDRSSYTYMYGCMMICRILNTALGVPTSTGAEQSGSVTMLYGLYCQKQCPPSPTAPAADTPVSLFIS